VLATPRYALHLAPWQVAVRQVCLSCVERADLASVGAAGDCESLRCTNSRNEDATRYAITRFAPMKIIGAAQVTGPESPRWTMRIAIVGKAVTPKERHQ
jgi:hypothetical protein